MSLDAIFQGLQILVGNFWQPFLFARAGQRTKSALFALKNFVATGNFTSYVNIRGMYFQLVYMANNYAELREVIFDLKKGQRVPRSAQEFHFHWDSIEMSPVRMYHYREPQTLAELARESYDTEHEPYGQI